jgi:hypothetical protein
VGIRGFLKKTSWGARGKADVLEQRKCEAGFLG